MERWLRKILIPHKDDLVVDGQKMRQQIIEDMKAIEQACNQLEIDLQTEEDTRQNADNQEAEARSEADSAEQQSRQAEDNNLQSQVNILRGRLDTAEKNISDLQTKQKADEEQIAKIYEAVFGIPSVILNEATSVDDEDNDDQPLEEINTERNGFLDAQ